MKMACSTRKKTIKRFMDPDGSPRKPLDVKYVINEELLKVRIHPFVMTDKNATP